VFQGGRRKCAHECGAKGKVTKNGTHNPNRKSPKRDYKSVSGRRGENPKVNKETPERKRFEPGREISDVQRRASTLEKKRESEYRGKEGSLWETYTKKLTSGGKRAGRKN